jgi:hypothetical protein
MYVGAISATDIDGSGRHDLDTINDSSLNAVAHNVGIAEHTLIIGVLGKVLVAEALRNRVLSSDRGRIEWALDFDLIGTVRIGGTLNTCTVREIMASITHAR